MNPSTALARTVVGELVRCGVREAVVAPGSRSAPLAIALDEADRRGELRLHMRIDERSASYLALGLARASGRAVPVVCTSGTAAAILHGAVLEASQSGVPLLVLTADRPPELRGTGANQTIDQLHLYGRAVRWFAEVGVAEGRDGEAGYWRSVASRAVLVATDDRDPGPVHLNLAFREPLVPDDDDGADAVAVAGASAAAASPGRRAAMRQPAAAAALDVSEVPVLRGRGVVLVGDLADVAEASRAVALAGALGWPVLSEPSGNARRGPNAIAAYPLLLADDAFAAEHQPDVVLTVGRVTLSRAPLAMARAAGSHVVVDRTGRWSDPTRSAAVILDQVPTVAGPQGAPEGWLDSWRAADARAAEVIDALLGEGLSEPAVSRLLAAALPEDAVLLVGSSRPGRDLEAFSRADACGRILANRGVAGIDGLVSSAVGAALAHQRDGGGHGYALMGDLSLIHDSNGLVISPGEPVPGLTVVVVDNDGGGIFGTLPPSRHRSFERLFATPHGLDLTALCRASGVETVDVASPAELVDGLTPRPGMRVLHVRTDRRGGADLLRVVQERVSEALAWDA